MQAIELTHDHVLSGIADGCDERARVLREGGTIEGGRLSGFLEVARAFGDLDQLTGCKPAGLSGTPELTSQPLSRRMSLYCSGQTGCGGSLTCRQQCGWHARTCARTPTWRWPPKGLLRKRCTRAVPTTTSQCWTAGGAAEARQARCIGADAAAAVAHETRSERAHIADHGGGGGLTCGV